MGRPHPPHLQQGQDHRPQHTQVSISSSAGGGSEQQWRSGALHQNCAQQSVTLGCLEQSSGATLVPCPGRPAGLSSTCSAVSTNAPCAGHRCKSGLPLWLAVSSMDSGRAQLQPVVTSCFMHHACWHLHVMILDRPAPEAVLVPVPAQSVEVRRQAQLAATPGAGGQQLLEEAPHLVCYLSACLAGCRCCGGQWALPLRATATAAA
jgi:hypothetical protein